MTRRPRKVYVIGSVTVAIFWLIAFLAIAWSGELTISGDEVSFRLPDQVVSSTPLGDPMISSHFFYTSTIGAVMLFGGAVVMSLVAVNGIIAFTRR